VRILAFSDLHGSGFLEAEHLIDEYRPDWVVLCGDMLPDFSQRPEDSRLAAQQKFWKEQRAVFIREGMVTTFIQGNHELPGFRDDAMAVVPTELDGCLVRLEGIPGDSGPFSFARGLPESELEAELRDQLSQVMNPLIYISHAPPFGSCDKSQRGDHIGHRPLFRHLQGRNWPQVLVLCGHVHQSFGMEEAGGTTILNLATGYAFVEWTEGRTQVMAMARIVEGSSFWDSP
jgi:Icc-related predicted phosphoesterase